MLFCGNAARIYMPPYVIYEGLSAKVFDTWMVGGQHLAMLPKVDGWKTMFLKHVLKMYF